MTLFSLLFTALTLSASPVSLPGDGGVPAKAPRAVGMSATRLARIDRAVERGIRAGGYPGAAVVVGRKGATVWERGFGRLGWETTSGPVTANRTIYDLASLTKVVATTAGLMVLFDDGKIDLDAPVSRYLPAFSGGDKDLVTIRQLLEHRSGLPAGRDLWRLAHTPEEARDVVISTPLVCRPGVCYEYSDLGADILGFVVEAVSGERLDRFLERRVYGPLGMNETYFRPADSLRSRIAPTEDTPPRGYPLRGEVHDENAFALGGIAGHAGLFSTASDLAVFAQMMLNGGIYNGTRIIADSTVAIFTRRAAGTRALGWDTCGGSGSCGKYLGENAYGHTGFTGTSLWIDPEREMFVILLTNRVHDARARRPAKVISDVRADLADAAALAVMDYPDGPLDMPSAFRSDRRVGWNPPTRVARHRSARTSSRSSRSSAARSSRSTKRSASASRSRSSSSRAHAATRSRSSSGVRSSSSHSTRRNTAQASRSSRSSGSQAAKSRRTAQRR